MMRHLSAGILWLTVPLLGILICCNAHAGVEPGATPPDYLGKTLNWHPVKLSQLRGKVVVISFWATWCHYCMEELPILAGIQKTATEHELKMQVVAVDSQEPHRTFVRAAELLHKKLPSLIVTWDRTGKIGKPYGADKSIPVMVMVRRDGKVAYIHHGYDKSELGELVREINTLLNAKTSASSPASAR